MADESNSGILEFLANLISAVGFAALLVGGFWFIGELDGCIYVSIPD